MHCTKMQLFDTCGFSLMFNDISVLIMITMMVIFHRLYAFRFPFMNFGFCISLLHDSTTMDSCVCKNT
jgi:hypothetical protein